MISLLMSMPFFFLYPLLRSCRREGKVNIDYAISFSLSFLGAVAILLEGFYTVDGLLKIFAVMTFGALCAFIAFRYKRIFGGSFWWFNEPIDLYEWFCGIFCLFGIVMTFVFFGLSFL